VSKKLRVERLLADRAGFSLTELLVALVVSGLLVVGVAGGYVMQKQTYEHEAHLRELQLNGRIAMEQIARVVRNAGLGCRENFPPHGNESVHGYSSVFTALNQTSGPDTLTVVTGVASRTRVAETAQGNVIRLAVADAFRPSPDKRSHIFIAPWHNNRFQTITAMNDTYVTVSTPRSVFAGDKVFRVSAYTIELRDFGDEEGDPRLLMLDHSVDLDDERSAQVAEAVEDLQFQYGWDADNNGIIDDHEYLDDPAGMEDQIRAVRIFLLVRSELPDPHYTDDAGTYTIADRTIVLDTDDGNGIDSEFDHRYRRQLFVKTVMVRNHNL